MKASKCMGEISQHGYISRSERHSGVSYFFI